MGGKFRAVFDAVSQAMARTPRSSSLVENLNSRLRNYFTLRRHLGSAYLDLLRFFLNHRCFMRSRLAGSKYLAGGDYTIAVWPWYGGLAKGWLYGAAEFLAVEEYKNVQRWADAIGKRPAVQRGRMVDRVTGEPSSQLHHRHDAGDFEAKTQDKLVTES